MRKIEKRLFVAPLLLFSFLPLLLPSNSSAGEPTEVVRQTIEEARRIINNDAITEDQKIRELRGIAEERFDFYEMSRRTLATHWDALKPAQKQEFVSLFSKLIEDSFSTRIRKYKKEIREHSKDRVLYLDERVKGTYATVKTQLITFSGIVVPVNYRFIKKEGKWLAYDVVAEGISLINNYRSQFSEILMTGSYEELLTRLRGKTLN